MIWDQNIELIPIIKITFTYFLQNIYKSHLI